MKKIVVLVVLAFVGFIAYEELAYQMDRESSARATADRCMDKALVRYQSCISRADRNKDSLARNLASASCEIDYDTATNACAK